MKIPFEVAARLVANAGIVMVENSDIKSQVSLGFIYNDIMVEWDDDTGSYELLISEDDNEEVEKDGNKLLFVANEGEVELQLFNLVPIK